MKHKRTGRSSEGTRSDQRFAEAGGTTVITVCLKSAQLGEYIAEKAGLIDVIGDAEIWFDGGPLTLTPDFATVAAAEDTVLGPRLPRRRRPR